MVQARLSFIGAGPAIAALVLACGGDVVRAQDTSKYFTVQHPEKFSIDWRGFYDRIDALTAETREALPHHLDLAYGADPKQKVDLYLPERKASVAPVFIFLHGGGFREGDRAHYGYVARPFARHGVLTAVASYRLLPHHYPDQVEDTRALVAWLHRNVARYGGDPRRLFIGGHSAGAILSALVSVERGWLQARGLPRDLIRGVVPVSGPYDLRKPDGFVKDFLPDPARGAEASPALKVDKAPPPAVVAYGSTETPYVKTSQEFVDRLRAQGGQAELVVLEGMPHDATALAVMDENGPLFRAILRMIDSDER